jgi:hypothetical protein
MRRRGRSALAPARRGAYASRRVGATEGVRGTIRTLASGRQSWSVQGASSKRPRPRAHQERTMLTPSGRHPRGHLCDRCRSWRLAFKRGSTRSCPPPRFRPGGEPWKPASPAKVGGEGDSRIERSKGYSSCRSVADAGKDASSPAGRSRPQGRERRRRVSSTRRLHVDDGGAARSGRKGAG